MEDIDVPQYFLCPISLQIMTDPVTTITGITYDRGSIEQWLFSDDALLVCPVTKLPLSTTSDLTPNHMLRRLIQAWCVANAIDRIPTPKSPLQRSVVLKLLRDVRRRDGDALSQVNALKKLEEFAVENEKNHRIMAEAGVPNAMVSFLLKCFKDGKVSGLEHALRTLRLVWSPTDDDDKLSLGENVEVIQSILWILNSSAENSTKTNALVVLKNVLEVADSATLQKLKLDFFEEMVGILRGNNNTSPQAVKSVLQVLIRTCPWGRNRVKIVEAGAVFEVIELGLGQAEKRTTELAFCLLAHLCSCADGRQQLLQHAAGIAVAAKRLLRNSAATDEWAVSVMESIARFSATAEVVREMVRVGAVAKLCMVLQADSADYLKRKAREILRLHSNAWSNSSCAALSSNYKP